MQNLPRHSARLANTRWAAYCSTGRQRAITRSNRSARSFTSGTRLRSPGRPPNNGQPDGRSLEQKREAQDQFGHAKADPSVEADTKSNGDSRKPALRRTYRQRRYNEPPKPPPIPEWFLRHNVILVKDAAPGMGTHQNAPPMLNCVDNKTGHVLFTVPYYRRRKERKDITQKKDSEDPQSPSVKPQKLSVAQPAASPEESKGQLSEDKPTQIIAGTFGSSEASQQPSSPQLSSAAGPKKHRMTGSISRDFFDHKYTASSEPGRAQQPISTNPVWYGNGFQHMLCAILEAETAIHAALSMSNNTQHASSFAASRVDISLTCPDPEAHAFMDELVLGLGEQVGANVIRLDANDLEELMGEYVGGGSDFPGSFSTLGYDAYEGYVASGVPSSFGVDAGAEEANEYDADEDDAEEDVSDARRDSSSISADDLKRVLFEKRHQLARALSSIGLTGIHIGVPVQVNGTWPSYPQRESSGSVRSAPTEPDAFDGLRLGASLDHLLNAAVQKTAMSDTSESSLPDPTSVSAPQSPYRIAGARAIVELACLYSGVKTEPAPTPQSSIPHKGAAGGSLPTIVHVRDLNLIQRSTLGAAIVRRLIKVVQKRRRSGEQIVLVGTTAQEPDARMLLNGPQSDDFPLRTVYVPSPGEKVLDWLEPTSAADGPAYRRILEVNLRHVQSMLRRLKPTQEFDLLAPAALEQMQFSGTLAHKILSITEVQQLALTAIGLALSYARSDVVTPAHLTIAERVIAIAGRSRTNNIISPNASNADKDQSSTSDSKGKSNADSSGSDSRRSRVDEIRASCNPHETRLLTGVVDAKNIRTGFSDVHAPQETIDALKTLTTLSLLRPEAFSYGVLASDRLPGLLLYGPPGTGKTLLAKAVAKESQATVLEVSGAQIYEKYVGEGEKMVRAVFSLAKKLSPCVVFIDEADAIFGSRSSAGNRNTHREIINQFLREWDGMDDHSVFMMVASNRPFDLDDAVLRRLPRRLLVDLPVQKDRESILKIHLKNEILDDSVSLLKLAEQTPLYSGSDLKNLCVAAALACVREENELAVAHKDDKDFKLPEKRTLTAKHFEKAITEISASISEDMPSLNAIRKFDEQYGDRRGRRKKASYGFGTVDGAIAELAVRAMETEQRARPP